MGGNIYEDFQFKRMFNVSKFLGRGAYGAVFEGHHVLEKTSYALKLLVNVNDSNNALKEIQTNHKMPEHKNVVKYHNAWEECVDKKYVESLIQDYKIPCDLFNAIMFSHIQSVNFVCLQLELCEEDLRHWLGNINEPCKEYMATFTQIAEGIHHIHKSGLIHRDLKPENIFLKNGIVKIGDLGISKKHIGVTRSASHTVDAGTYWYQAPELKSKTYGTKVDWYAAGLILFEMFYPDIQPVKCNGEWEDFLQNFDKLKYMGELPQQLEKDWSIIARLIQKLTKFNVNDRGDYNDIITAVGRAEGPENETSERDSVTESAGGGGTDKDKVTKQQLPWIGAVFKSIDASYLHVFIKRLFVHEDEYTNQVFSGAMVNGQQVHEKLINSMLDVWFDKGEEVTFTKLLEVMKEQKLIRAAETLEERMKEKIH